MIKNRPLYLRIGVAVIVLDQIAKLLVRRFLPYNEIVRLFDGELVWFVFVQNPGIAFGIGILPPLVLTLIALIAAVGIGIYLYWNPSMPHWNGIPLALIMGGAAGNMIDRILFGKVVDFISVDMPDCIMHRWPAFNIADSAVSIGAVWLILVSLFLNIKVKQRK